MDDWVSIFFFFVAVWSVGMIMLILGVFLFGRVPYWFDQLTQRD